MAGNINSASANAPAHQHQPYAAGQLRDPDEAKYNRRTLTGEARDAQSSVIAMPLRWLRKKLRSPGRVLLFVVFVVALLMFSLARSGGGATAGRGVVGTGTSPDVSQEEARQADALSEDARQAGVVYEQSASE